MSEQPQGDAVHPPGYTEQERQQLIEQAVIFRRFTEQFLVEAGIGRGMRVKSPVSEWMTRNPITATANTTIGEAAEVMLTNGFRRLPVVEGRQLKGMVSIRDVLASGIRRRSNLV
jgi:signal-transduction protein with cAMP-binding, CBS, and nucleotidyltransferase domain